MTEAWSTKVRGDVVRLDHHPGVVTAVVDDESDAGPAVSVLSAAEGVERGRVETEGTVQGVEHYAAPGLLLVTTDADRIHAVDPETGRERWAADAAGVLTASADRVFLYAAARVWAYGVADGAVEWETTLRDEQYGGLSRNVADGKLLVTVGEYEDKGLVALDPDTGVERWYYHPGSVENILVDEGIYVQFAGDERAYDVVRIDATTGREAWSYTSERSLTYGLHPTTNRLYIDENRNGTVAAVDPVTGSERWRSGKYRNTEKLRIEDGTPYVVWETEDREYEFHALDPDTGRSAWHAELAAEGKTVAFDEGDVYVGTRGDGGDDGLAYRIDGTTGRVRWRFATGESIRDIDADATPTLICNFAGSVVDDEPSESTLFAVDAADGDPRWTLSDKDLTILQTTPRLVGVKGADQPFDFDGTYYIVRRDDGTVERRLDADAGVGTEGALFVAEGSRVTAYPLAERPAAFEGAGDGSIPATMYDPDDRTRKTEVYDGDDGTGQTDVYDPDDGTACSSCGADLDAYGEISFCPECGSETG